MALIANILVGIVAALHAYFLVLEMFFWTKPLGLSTFRMTLESSPPMPRSDFSSRFSFCSA
jgi:putative membrane protein